MQLNAVNGEQVPGVFIEADWHELEQSLAFERTISHVPPVAVAPGQVQVHSAPCADSPALPW